MRFLLLILLASVASADALRVTVKADTECGHIHIINQTTGEMDTLLLSDFTGNEPTENKYILAAREYMDARSINRAALTKFIARNFLDGITINLDKYLSAARSN